MWSPRSSSSAGQGGFTLIELMIGVVIGLLASLAVTHVLVNSEGQKRATTSGSDAQVNGALALSTLQRAMQPAGYGFAATPAVVGCTLSASWNGAAIAGFPTVLAPVTISDGASDGPDAIRILASGKTSYSIPLRVVAPGYTAGNTFFPVGSVRGIAQGDLVVAAPSISSPPGTACEVFQVTANPGSVPQVDRVDNAWNAAGVPATSYGDGAGLLNMGVPLDVTYSISNNKALVANTLNIADAAHSYEPSYSGTAELFPNIVQLQAMYGKDADGDGNVDTWDNVTPGTNAEWLKVIAVRIALVSRSSQYEKEEVTFDNVSWDVGLAGSVAGAVTCPSGTGGGGKCLTIKIDTLPDWKHYRYKLFETIVPLRNLLWNS